MLTDMTEAILIPIYLFIFLLGFKITVDVLSRILRINEKSNLNKH